MHLPRSITRRAAIAAVLMAATGAASVPVLAASNAAAPAPSAPSGQAVAGQHGRHGQADIRLRLARELVGQVATLTQQSPKQVREQLRAGKSLSEIAGSQAGAAEAATLKEVQARLDKAVSAGKLTKPQEDKLLVKAKTGIDALMNKHFRAGTATAAGTAAK